MQISPALFGAVSPFHGPAASLKKAHLSRPSLKSPPMFITDSYRNEVLPGLTFKAMRP